MASESDLLFDQEGMTEEEIRIEQMFEEADEYMISLKDFKKAKSIYQNILKIDPNNIDAINSLSQWIQSMNEDSYFDKCKSLYNRSLEIWPDDYMTNFYMGILYYKWKYNDRSYIMKSLEYLLKAEASDSNTSVLYNIAVIYEEIGELHNAESYYLRILDINKTIDHNETIKDAIREQNLKVYNSLAVNSK